MEPIAGLVASFKIYPEPPSSRYFVVRVFETLTAMRDYARSRGSVGVERAAAMALSFQRIRVYASGRSRTLPCCGEMLLARGYVTTENVTHEAAHLALRYAERAKFSPLDGVEGDSGGEERLCYAIGRMSHQVAKYVMENGIAP